MEDDGGQYLTSPVDPEIKNAMKRVLSYFEKAHKIKATKLNVKKLRKSIALWLANMTCKDDKDFSYELSNRQGYLNIWLEFIKWFFFMSNHTLVALLTAIFEKCGMKHGSEQHVTLIQQSKDLFLEFKVRSPFNIL
jgi:fatty acid amide hydrolase 2